MRTFAKSQIRYSKSQRMGIFALIGLIVCLEATSFFLNREREINSVVEIPPELRSLQNQIDPSQTFNSSSQLLQDFNPNALSAQEWQDLGFSEKQVNTILKYKNSLGGNFSSKEEIRNCFVISETKYEELEPFIQLKSVKGNAVPTGNTYSSYNSNQFQPKEKPRIRYSAFNPNEYSSEDWQNIGFSYKQANSILKYKRSLGGKFSSLDQIEASFVISPEKFQEMKPFIRIPLESKSTQEEIPSTPKELPKATKVIEKFNPNNLSVEEWMELGFTEKQVNTIMNYKRSLGGKFKNAEVLKKSYSISEEKFKEIEPFLVFE